MKRAKKKLPSPHLSFQHILTAGIALSAFTLCASILVWAYPSLVSRAVSLPKELLARSGQASVETETDSTMASSPELPSEREDSQKGLEKLISSGELGEIKDFDAYLTAETDETAYYYIMDSAMGPMIYYNQGDSRWADYLYGVPRLRSHGRGYGHLQLFSYKPYAARGR